MKKVFFSLAAALVLAISIISCNTNSPKASADKFLTGFYHLDYKAAKSVSTESTKNMLNMMEQFSTMLPDSAKENAKKVKINIKDVQENGDKATVTYNTSENETDQKLDLVKQNGKWLVEWNKQDPGMEGSDESMSEEPMPDTTVHMEGPDAGATTPADTATTR
jgi:hypothetical protein